MTDGPNHAAISRAADRLRAVVRRTPLEPNERLSAELGVPVLFKREDLQLCRSYKVRGAYHLISSLDADERRRGVVCASAGNHGQGVAYSCSVTDVTGRVYLPGNTPLQKRQRIAAVGRHLIKTVVVGSHFDEADVAARHDSEQTGAVYVHPFDDPRTIAGQGTVAVEIAEQHADPIDTVIVPVGGGGLIAGMLIWLKHHLPHVYVVGAEPAGAASMRAAVANGGPVPLGHIDTFVDGAAVARVGGIGYQVVSDLVDELVSVPEGAACAEMIDLYQVEGIIAEPAGALAGAAARMRLRRRPQGPVVCVLSGGNNDITRYREVLERARRHGAVPVGADRGQGQNREVRAVYPVNSRRS